MGKTADLLPGTLDMLILKAVSLRRCTATACCCASARSRATRSRSRRGRSIPALYRLEHQGLIAAEWGQSENNRRAKFYTLTAAGRRRLREETAGWNRLAAAIAAALDTTPDEV